jgi:DNA-binding beta-propeller fold protein YncE
MSRKEYVLKTISFSSSDFYPSITCSFMLILGIIGFPGQTFGFENVEYVRDFRGGLQEPVDVTLAVNGDLYVLDKEASKVFVFDSSGKPKRDFGKAGPGPGQFDEPQGMAVSPQGQIFVGDTDNDRIQAFDSTGKFLFKFGSSGKRVGQFDSPRGVAIDQFGIIFIADHGNNRIQAFSQHGIFLRDFPLEGAPQDVAIDPKRNLYVLIPDLSMVVKIHSDRKKVEKFSNKTKGLDFLASAHGIAVDMRGDLYITEQSDESVQKLDSEGNVLVTFGSDGEGRGQFDEPSGLAADSKGNVLIADTDNHRIQMFQVNGSERPLMPVQTQSPPIIEFDSFMKGEKAITSLVSFPGKGLYVLSKNQNHILHIGSSNHVYGKKGSGPGEVDDPQAIAVTPEGTLAIADTGNDRVQLFDSNGSSLYQFGKAGEKTGQFDEPAGIGISQKNLIYVSDTENHRVQIFNKDAIFLTVFGQESEKVTPQTPEHGKFNEPKSLAINSSHQVYVLDTNNHRVQMFGEEGKFIKVIGAKGQQAGQFMDPTDIAVDEQDYLFVADRGNHRVQVFDPKGDLVFLFGAPAGNKILGFSFGAPMVATPGTFTDLSAIAVSDGKVYVADSKSDQIQVFRFYPRGLVKEERIFLTTSAFPPPGQTEDKLKAQNLAKDIALQQAIKELAIQTGQSSEEVEHALRVERVETLSTGVVQVTVSLPKNMGNAETTTIPAASENDQPKESEEFILQ